MKYKVGEKVVVARLAGEMIGEDLGAGAEIVGVHAATNLYRIQVSRGPHFWASEGMLELPKPDHELIERGRACGRAADGSCFRWPDKTTAALDLLRFLRRNDGECLADHPDWLARMDALLEDQ